MKLPYMPLHDPEDSEFGDSISYAVDGAVAEIEGPCGGFYLACYTVREDDGFRGYVKICAERPDDVWDSAGALHKLAGPVCFNTWESMRKAMRLAYERLGVKSEKESLARLVGGPPSRLRWYMRRRAGMVSALHA